MKRPRIGDLWPRSRKPAPPWRDRSPYRALFINALLAVLTTTGIPAQDEPGYLAVVGPAELRFQKPKAPARTMALPPLTPPAKPPLTKPETVARPTPGPTPSPTAAATTPPPMAGPVAPHLPVVPGPSPVPGEGRSPSPTSGEYRPTEAPQTDPASNLILPQPQLFLHYFTQEFSTGSNAVMIPVPVGFNPPQPRASSSADYQVVPAEKP